MQNQISVFIGDSEFQCTQFFDADKNVSGIDIYLNGEHKGEIIGLEIPDIDDEQSTVKFNEAVKTWEYENVIS